MSAYKADELLQKLMKMAKEISGGDPAINLERFLLAAMDMAEKTPEDALTQEEASMKSRIQEYFPNMEEARKHLRKSLVPGNVISNSDKIQWERAMRSCREKTEECQLVVPALSLLDYALQNPTLAIEAARIAAGGKVLQPEDYEWVEDYDYKPEYSPEEEQAYLERKRKEARWETAGLVEGVKYLHRELSQVVYGQDKAISTFVTGYFQAQVQEIMGKGKGKPKATFLFAGPPGVGKTFLAENIAKMLQLPFGRFDMSEYADKEANIEFCGSDKVYKNGKAGNVTSFVAQNPCSVLLFDEIEKAHLKVIYLFLQMLDAGRLRDNYTDTEVSFEKTIIILTTNAGRQLYEDSVSGNFSAVSRKVIIGALQKDIDPETKAPYFPPAICSRFASGNVVMFNQISASSLIAIARNEILRHGENLQEEMGIGVQVEDAVYTALLLAEGAAADARTVSSRARTFFNDELYELLRLIQGEKTEELEQIRITVDLERASKEIRSLFYPDKTPRMLVFAEENTVAACREMAGGLHVLGAGTPDEAKEILKKKDIDFVLLDLRCGIQEDEKGSLNLEDAPSAARDFFKFLRMNRSGLPVYLLEGKDLHIDREARISFERQGVRGVVSMAKEKGGFGAQMAEIATGLHQQESLIKLARANKLVSFETAQSISQNGKSAQIRLFDLSMSVAVDSEDRDSVLSHMSRPDVTFRDVIGAREAKKELAYFAEYLKDPKKYTGTGVKTPRGVLLYGPPGTGKTLLAKAVAGESDVTFLAAEGNQFLQPGVGSGSQKVHELFRKARKYAPAIVFIDEIDAIAKERSGFGIGEDTLTAFLAEMDGFSTDTSKPVFVLAATNFDVEPGSPKSLDPALMRRFDRRVYIGLPGKEERIAYLKMQTAKNPAFCISPQVLDNVAVRSMGMSLAELESAMELALRSAIRDGSRRVTDSVLEEAFETFNNGEIKRWDASQLERVARHEAGHAFLCWHAGRTPSYLTIVARGDHGGYMQHDGQEGKAIFTKAELLGRIRTALGGRAAELLYYGANDGVTTGASGDLASATLAAQQIVCQFGMDEAFGLAVIGEDARSGSMSAEVRKTVNAILNAQLEQALKILSENKKKLDALVEALLAKNYLTGPEIQAMLEMKEEK